MHGHYTHCTQIMHGPVHYICTELYSTNMYMRYWRAHIWLQGSGIHKIHT